MTPFRPGTQRICKGIILIFICLPWVSRLCSAPWQNVVHAPIIDEIIYSGFIWDKIMDDVDKLLVEKFRH